MLRQHKFLTGLLTKLDKEDTAQQVLEDLKRLQTFLTKPANLRIHMAASTSSLGEAAEKAWVKSFLPAEVKGTKDV